MPTCVPVRELKDTAKFTSLVESASEPITVTRNGRDAFVVMTSDMYDGMRQELAREKLYRVIDHCDEQIERGEYVDGDAFLGRMRERYGA